VPEITGLRFSPHGVDAALVNISDSGLLAECEQQIKPGSAVTIAVAGTFEPKTIDGRVARCAVSSIARNGKLRYHVAVAFGKAIALGALAGDAAAVASDAEATSAGAAQEPVVTAANEPLVAAAAVAAVAPIAPPAPPARNRW
jgi:hypothetical protein